MRDVFSPPGMMPCLLGAVLWVCPLVLACQDVTPKERRSESTAARPTAPSVDPRFRSPRATVRTFLIAMNLTED
ncbi:MAG: hypothetical protein JO116_24100, partial [Planctomycetaceae bacterium]|nr:hypothetical protein [Planctomycetaceae bacterium]